MIDESTIISAAINLNKSSFDNLLGPLDNYYHNNISLVDDKTYDELIDIYEAKYGKYRAVGAEPTGEKIELPYYLGSLRKLKKEAEVIRWLKSHNGPFIIEDKIDGLTLLLVSSVVNNQRIVRLYIRGGDIEELMFPTCWGISTYQELMRIFLLEGK